jgi:hypothetical protein
MSKSESILPDDVAFTAFGDESREPRLLTKAASRTVEAAFAWADEDYIYDDDEEAA